jgi:NAD(P)H-hydrate repair Nnr-like enzyme with NAD(P)H-hydrate dehydratase domain
VLTGLVGGLLAQHAGKPGAPSLLDLVRIGVLAHALAGEAWALSRSAQAGMLASELAEELPSVLEGFRQHA